MMIFFTKYAKQKFDILQQHRCLISKGQVKHVVEIPDAVDDTKHPLCIAERKIDAKRLLKVIYKKEAGIAKIITFYPSYETGNN